MKKIITIISIVCIAILATTVLHGQTPRYHFKFPPSLSDLKKAKIHAGPIDTLELYQYPPGNKRYLIDGSLEHAGSADLSIPINSFPRVLFAYQDSLSKMNPNLFMLKDYGNQDKFGAIVYLKRNFLWGKHWAIIKVRWDGIVSVPSGTKAFYTKLNDKSPLM